MNTAMLSRSVRVSAFVAVLTVLAAFPSAAVDLPSANIPDDSALRSSILDSWLQAAPSDVLKKKSEIHQLIGGGNVEVRVEKGKDEFMVVLAREHEGKYPSWSQGSWVLYRRYSDGAPTRVRVFLRSDPYTQVQFRPDASGRTLLDVSAYGAFMVRSALVSQRFDRLLVLPLERVLAAAGAGFPRRYFDPNPDDYADVRELRGSIRARLGELSYADDGAFDAEGKAVFIETLAPQAQNAGLNCSGFAKWVVDGILRPVTGRRLGIEELKTPYGDRGSSFSEPYEDVLDPFFGLDWTRNLACAAAKTTRGGGASTLAETEVRSSPVVSLRVSGDPSSQRSYLPYLPDVGFAMEGLKATLYGLAVDEPGRIYLAAISTEMGDKPRLRRYFHVAVFLPLFEEDGTFSIAVFESAVETKFDSFIARYPLMHANLMRVQVEDRFDP